KLLSVANLGRLLRGGVGGQRAGHAPNQKRPSAMELSDSLIKTAAVAISDLVAFSPVRKGSGRAGEYIHGRLMLHEMNHILGILRFAQIGKVIERRDRGFGVVQGDDRGEPGAWFAQSVQGFYR